MKQSELEGNHVNGRQARKNTQPQSAIKRALVKPDKRTKNKNKEKNKEN